MQKEALERIRELGLPTRRTEDWHYFPTARLSACKGLSFIEDRNAPVPECESPCEQSLGANFPESDFGITGETDITALLPMAMGAKILYKEIRSGEEYGILKPRDPFSHTVFRIGGGAKASLEILENKSIRELSAERLDFFVGEGATLELYSTEEGHESEIKFRSIRIHQAKDSQVEIIDFNRSESLRRIDVETHLSGENALFGYRELNILRKASDGNGFVRVFHEAPRTKSRQFIRNLLSGSSRLSYDGGVTAGADCPGTDSSELINTILLSDDAKVSVKPTLKIYHDDVACSHGNTVGTLDAESLFYLESRGIDKLRAKELLLRAFAVEVIREHPFAAARARLGKLLETADFSREFG